MFGRSIQEEIAAKSAKNWPDLRPDTANHVDHIDASLFSGCEFSNWGAESQAARDMLRKVCNRWLKALDENDVNWAGEPPGDEDE